MPHKHARHIHDARSPASETVSWWSWRPGIKPWRAFVFGGLSMLLTLFLLLSGVVTLTAGLLDSSLPPLRLTGTVSARSKTLLGSPQLTIRFNASTSITLPVSTAASQALPSGTTVEVDFGPYLHAPYSLENAGHNYPLPGTSPAGNPLEAALLLLAGLLLFPYPALLFFWGWRDLRSGDIRQVNALVVAVRTVDQTTTRGPGMLPRRIHTWHGIAVQPTSDEATAHPRVLTFAIQAGIAAQLHQGDKVQVGYSPHLRHLYTLKLL